ncbi:MAG: ketoacyl-ACP synthase III [Clostridiales bacterium]|nr:ketoacyl-ACP synthase III [Clostridiales bacterium]
MSLMITGTGSCAPSSSAGNVFFERLVDTTDEWITARTGIKNRHIISGETLSELATAAARRALESAGTEAAELDLIICATMQGDYIIPSMGCVVQREIGATCPAFDLNAACAGFLFALDVADGLISSGKYNKILIVCSDQLSKFIDYSDRSTCVLFGDGAGAAVVERGDSLRYIRICSKGDADLLSINSARPKSPFFVEGKSQGYLAMSGQDVFKFAVSAVVGSIKEACAAMGITPDDIDYFLLHQANGRIIDMAKSQLGQPCEKFLTNLAEYGNTSAASIPLLLDEQRRKGTFKRGDMLAISGFGGGLCWGTCLLKWAG